LSILHVLAQKPGQTGSGIFFESLAREGDRAGLPQEAIVGVSALDPTPAITGITPEHLHPVLFDSQELPFPVPGMSDEMPYRSTVFSDMDASMLRAYREAFAHAISSVVAQRRPDMVWSHHLWLVSALVGDVAPQIPLSVFCHGTEIRQASKLPELALRVCEKTCHFDCVFTLSQAQRKEAVSVFSLDEKRVHVLGGGIRDDIFWHPRLRRPGSPVEVLYVGKMSSAKGVPQLLEAMEYVWSRPHGSDVHLTLVGSGEGTDAEAILGLCEEARERITCTGQLPQQQVADAMRRAHVFALPSFFEGLGLVVLEALACGCRVVASQLPSLAQTLPQDSVPHDMITYVPLPPMVEPGVPVQSELHGFTQALAEGLWTQVERARGDDSHEATAAVDIARRFSWKEIFRRALDATVCHQ
jgi:glycosyltransferase involved in cell wall biosynthesis